MLKLVSIFLIIFSSVIQLGFSAFDDVKIPMKKIEKSVKKEFMGSEFKLLPIDGYNKQNPYTKIYQIESMIDFHDKETFISKRNKTIIEVITAEDLVKKQGQTVANVLSQVAGVEINGNQSFNGKNLGLIAIYFIYKTNKF